MRARRPFQSAAFTLVEMLVVIMIIAILAAMLLPAINRVRTNAMNAQIAVEISDMGRAVEAYKEKYGDYPPDFTNRDLVRRHIYTAWPNIQAAEYAAAEAVFWPSNPNLPQVDPAEALVFWLSGFSTDPKHPFTGRGGPFLKNPAGVIVGPNLDRDIGTFGFDQSRLDGTDDGDGFPVYPPPRKLAPYTYFDCRTYGGRYYQSPHALGAAKPYLNSRSLGGPLPHEWVNKNTFQIISAGLDEHYGAVPPPAQYYPDGTNYLSPGDGDDDNITNFSEGKTLKDMKP